MCRLFNYHRSWPDELQINMLQSTKVGIICLVNSATFHKKRLDARMSSYTQSLPSPELDGGQRRDFSELLLEQLQQRKHPPIIVRQAAPQPRYKALPNSNLQMIQITIMSNILFKVSQHYKSACMSIKLIKSTSSMTNSCMSEIILKSGFSTTANFSQTSIGSSSCNMTFWYQGLAEEKCLSLVCAPKRKILPATSTRQFTLAYRWQLLAWLGV